ncbi:MAG: amino acid adenylation domain-containing protein [Candidatus Aminicenantes bacterium]|nr:amino acid adenylation domain-containing protein [Candidatus Aminicenantes bacterium]NIM83459.1 amino acid adenylation domain-containing protein [Candidatus Aminicenantes bacterium]NIN22851.1 amino acid adenylation domain-containing protein [Candidatus Aminicenantes bacterium]NIN46587.1 amino acid adenylation domain-containing protein [Candidatus Aminicenantes bacterium]NIN89490.1 amino acid adenylation domain-containing protein [Candidatus Aminicenantes bacterium]
MKPMYLQDYFDENESLTGEMIPGNVLTQRKKLSNAQVLLLGDTPGMATTGLLYIASYLRRNGIKAYVQFNDPNSDGDSLRTGIEELLREINPTVVAVSMKWFLHIARVIEICKVVKGYSADIKVVVGGNTASYYPEDIIRYEWVDCVIRGDGELPLLEICRGAELDSVANCVYRKDGRIVKKPITYVQDKTNSQEIYLSHLDEILISNYSSIFGTFFIYTQKGCGMHCFFCAGCNRVQREIFNRPHLVIREPEQVRRDIREAMKYASNLKFDFDVVDKNLLDYCKKIWDGIDLSSHFCTITNLLPPPPELIEYVNKKFKYVYWNIDIASLSQRHREKLVSLGLVKPQPGDEEIIAFLDECDRYDNTEFIINLIAGLPYFNKEDIAASQEMLTYIMDNYTCFSELFWARLHAQPGAPVVEDAETYGMHSYAKTFADYLKYSRMNLEGSVIYPTVEYSHYPYIYYNNDEFNSKISKYYSETASALVEYKENKRKALHAGRTLSYRELNQRVNQLAWLLRKKGVKRNSIVGIMMTHSIDLITALLAVLKAGGAYLPVDPDYPAARRKFMLKDSGLNVLLTQKHFLEKDKELFTDFPLGNVIIVDDKNIYKDDGPTLGVVNKPEDLLYVIYTSGSTGRPKGVMIPHKNFVNLVEFHRKIFGENPLSRVSQVASLGFDAMAFEVWPCLSSGASLYIADDDTRLDPSAMKEWLIKNEITISFQPTIMAEHLLRLDWPGKRVALKALRAAGDKLTCYPTHEYPFRFYNLYGPTEDTVWTTWREVGVKTDSEKAPDIGKPTGNKRVYIIGPDWEIQPIGIAGELCISGDGLAWGYLNNPELTAEKFVENPYESHPDKRMYRSGDLARWLTDGNLEFLGRIDQQVKLRGFRIELGEIENHLLNRDDVKHVVVIAREDSSGDKYLCAYIVLDLPHPLLEKEFDISQLREYLAKRLPEYMIPTYFIQLERIPLTPNGKTDIRALPEPKYGKKEAGFVAPRNALEEKLVEIWSGILGIEKETIGIDDKFFELGGHSLKATQMMSEIHKKLNVKVPLVEIFKIPSIRGLSKFISSSPQDKYIALEKVGEREHYPLSSAQKRLYIMQQMEPQSLGYNLPTFVVLEEKVEIEELKAVFRKLIDRHESLRTSFEISGEEPVQRINKGVDFEFEYYESEKQEAIEIAKRFIRPFDLSRAPLMRVGFIRLKEGRQVLMVDMHHIVTDGSSMEILVKEFMLLYKGIELPPLNIQYKDYAVWQNSESWREVIMSQEEYWMEEFKNDPPLMDISTDFPRPRGKSFEGNSLEFEIGKEETIKLRVLANRIDATLYIVMLSLFYIFLSKLSGEEDIVVGTPLEGRNHGDLGSVIGMFVNTLVLRNYPVGEKTFYEFLREIKDRVLRAFENQDYQFEDLVERLGIKRDSSRNPLFDVLFAFQNLDEQIEDVSREKMVESFDFGFKPIQFDLILTGVEEGEKLSFIFEYCTKLFEKRTIERYIAYFKDIISTILENNNIKLADITIIRHLSSARAYIPEMAINF